MIVTKAYVTKLPELDSNIYRVRIPLMEDNTETEAEFNAILSHTTGLYNTLNTDDCVIVTFEDDKYDVAIILGKLFIEIPKESQAFGLFNQLEVTGSVVLPEDTKIGNYTPQDIFNLYQGVDSGTGGGSGSLNPEDLKEYVQGTNTERQDQGQSIEVYADHIRVMTGEEYDDMFDGDNLKPDVDKDLFDHTLFFLSSLSEKDIIND